MDRLGPALNRKQVDAWANAFTNFKWAKKEGTYKKPKGKAAEIDAAAMARVPFYGFKKANEVPEAFNIPAAFLAFLTKARLTTEAHHAVDSDGFLMKALNLSETVPTADSLAKFKAKLTPVTASTPDTVAQAA